MVSVAKFALGSHWHFTYENLLTENGIKFETNINTLYESTGNSADVIEFYVSEEDVVKAKNLKEKVWKGKKTQPYPKFMKIFWGILISAFILYFLVCLIIWYNDNK